MVWRGSEPPSGSAGQRSGRANGVGMREGFFTSQAFLPIDSGCHLQRRESRGLSGRRRGVRLRVGRRHHGKYFLRVIILPGKISDEDSEKVVYKWRPAPVAQEERS